MTEACRIILEKHPRDVVHVHHTKGFSFDVLRIAKESGGRVIYSIHDYYALSSDPNLLGPEGIFRRIPPSWKKCPGRLCTLQRWRNTARCALRSVDGIVAPSASALAMFDTVFKDVPTPRMVIPHGTIAMGSPALAPKDAKPTVCFLGCTHAVHKGKKIVDAVARALEHREARCIMLGKTGGTYGREQLPRLLRQARPHLVALLSTYPETFCMALSEAWGAGIPAYVTPMGALQERMKETGAGRIAASWDPEAIAEDIASFLESSDYRKALGNLQNLAVPCTGDMAKQYARLYDALRSKEIRNTSLPDPCTVIGTSSNRSVRPPVLASSSR